VEGMVRLMSFDISFYKDKKVFVTGHTGFKGAWLCRMLVNAGAVVTGYSLEPPTSPSLFELAGIEQDITSIIGDIRDYQSLKAAFDKAQPEIVLHLAAQPIVRDSYKDPHYTYETNVMGTVNILECVRCSSCFARGGTVSGEVPDPLFGEPRSEKLTTLPELCRRAEEKWNRRNYG